MTALPPAEVAKLQAKVKRTCLEDALAFAIERAKLPSPVREYPGVVAGRDFRFDFAWPEYMVLAEVDGGTWPGKDGKQAGRHIRGKGYEDGCEKCNGAVLAGYRVLRFTAAMVKDGRAVAAIRAALK